MDPWLKTQFDQALELHRQNRLGEARARYDAILARLPGHFDTLHMAGVLAAQDGRVAAAIALLEKAAAHNEGNALVHFNLANALLQAGELSRASFSYDQAIALGPRPEFYFNQAEAQRRLGRVEPALESYDRAVALRPDYARAHFNKANLLRELDRRAEAMASYDRAIAAKPDFVDAHHNRATTLRDLADLRGAIAAYDTVIELEPTRAEAWNDRAHAWRDLGDHAASRLDYARAFALKPALPYLLGNLLHAKMHLCDWEGLDGQLRQLRERLGAGESASLPFPVLGLLDSPSLQKSAAEAFARTVQPSSPPALCPPYQHDKIRVGFFSADLHDHATAYLLVEVLELLDRNRFQVVALSLGPDKDDGMRRRIRAAVDDFVDLRELSDSDAVGVSRRLEIDIAVDLKGYTGGGRPALFHRRAAPLQVSYLGYPGTLGTPHMDYVIADRIVIPPSARPAFTEHVVYLPHSYQPNDRQRAVSARNPTRQEAGLPEDALVFCCFNGSYKITPEIFGCWMRILRDVPRSVLWLLGESDAAMSNLRRAAAAAGIDPQRLVFAFRVELSEHLARHRAADLFLDTVPYNAHTTASDALWAGLPVLTLVGQGFASRVGASLLAAVGLPELVTTSLEAYQALSIRLASDRAKLEALRHRLASARATAPLFDPVGTTRALETAFLMMQKRILAGLPPADLGG
ncbi:MAG: tetratricopeptide repeat protein [Reyranellaceae bacterium]